MRHFTFWSVVRTPGYNIKVIRNSENSGVCYSLNKVIQSSTGDLIAPVDHDDLVDPKWYFFSVPLSKIL